MISAIEEAEQAGTESSQEKQSRDSRVKGCGRPGCIGFVRMALLLW
ncbi:MAG: hypothetical protein HFI57_10755 [Lachnospiraceae bacterium]|nr:hypothetical protein [Lachnospiraceae bacterium]